MDNCGKVCEKVCEEVVGRGWGKLWESGEGVVRVVRFGGKVFGFASLCSGFERKVWENLYYELQRTITIIVAVAAVFHIVYYYYY